ncbi:MAG: hypothetical protein AB9919_12995 [Geobacteraceae bacterium]
MRKSSRKQISPDFSESIQMNLDNLAEALRVPKKVVKAWRKAGLVSYPVRKEEFDTLVKVVNSTWGNRQMIRAQLAKMPVAERYYLVLTAELSMFERELYAYVLRWKLTKPNENLSKARAWGVMKERYPNASRQFNGVMLNRAKKWAANLISRTKRNGKDVLLLHAFDLKYIGNETGIIERRHIPTKAEIRARKNGAIASHEATDPFFDELDDLSKLHRMNQILIKSGIVPQPNGPNS